MRTLRWELVSRSFQRGIVARRKATILTGSIPIHSQSTSLWENLSIETSICAFLTNLISRNQAFLLSVIMVGTSCGLIWENCSKYTSVDFVGLVLVWGKLLLIFIYYRVQMLQISEGSSNLSACPYTLVGLGFYSTISQKSIRDEIRSCDVVNAMWSYSVFFRHLTIIATSCGGSEICRECFDTINYTNWWAFFTSIKVKIVSGPGVILPPLIYFCPSREQMIHLQVHMFLC